MLPPATGVIYSGRLVFGARLGLNLMLDHSNGT
jgi:hypothetical protein